MSYPVQARRGGDRLTLDYLLPEPVDPAIQEGADVIYGLSRQPKSLPPKYFYDDRGSELFEQITALPEYYLTRTETAILQTHADDIAGLVGPCELMELGSGSSTKTRYLLNALRRSGYSLRYLPVDVSGGMLEATAQQLLIEYPALTVHGLVGTYEAALHHPLPAYPYPRLVAFIGSTLGNLAPAECHGLLAQISSTLRSGDFFLLGVDLDKDPGLLEKAYNDCQGITAAFNLNMLSHLNWRFQGNFQVDRFQHRACYNPTASQIEIYIDSLQAQTVTLQGLNLTVHFEADEPLLSEISRKFNLVALSQDLHSVGLAVQRVFTDEKQWFGLILCQKP
ncbi:MAG TPA: L-histidine N(alpha)-methyltransferase [Leptolyngbyaceae cyanobacterium M65_K2018_010]|nr:L-histidine N(alpha)-methyltransferase [Leptolyngbyaceae cyanobacterium M65_K2018_010]